MKKNFTWTLPDANESELVERVIRNVPYIKRADNLIRFQKTCLESASLCQKEYDVMVVSNWGYETSYPSFTSPSISGSVWLPIDKLQSYWFLSLAKELQIRVELPPAEWLSFDIQCIVDNMYTSIMQRQRFVAQTIKSNDYLTLPVPKDFPVLRKSLLMISNLNKIERRYYVVLNNGEVKAQCEIRTFTDFEVNKPVTVEVFREVKMVRATYLKLYSTRTTEEEREAMKVSSPTFNFVRPRLLKWYTSNSSSQSQLTLFVKKFFEENMHFLDVVN